MLGKAITKLFVVSEMLFSGLLYLLTIYLVGKMQLEGAAAAHALNYLLYWVFMIFFVGRISLRKM